MNKVINWFSLPKVAIIVMVTKAILDPETSVAMATMVAAAFIAWGYELYEHLRHERSQWKHEDYYQVKGELLALEIEIGKLKTLNEVVIKQSEETKKILSNANLVSVFGSRKG